MSSSIAALRRAELVALPIATALVIFLTTRAVLSQEDNNAIAFMLMANALMLLVGFVFYRHGQKLLRQGYRDRNGEPTQGMVGPVGFLVLGAVGCYLLFALLRALARGEVPCVGKGCAGQIYTLAEQAGPYWANVFFLLWCVLAFGYALYVTLRIWLRP